MDVMTAGLQGSAAVSRSGAELAMRDLEIWVRLGCSAEERAVPQPIAVSALIRFAARPAACESDRLDDTVCYARLADVLSERARARAHHTVESLTFALAAAMRSAMPEGATFRLEVTKMRAPVPGLRGGVSFRMEG